MRRVLLLLFLILSGGKGEFQFTISGYFRELYAQCHQLGRGRGCRHLARKVEEEYLQELRESGVQGLNLKVIGKLVRQTCEAGCRGLPPAERTRFLNRIVEQYRRQLGP